MNFFSTALYLAFAGTVVYAVACNGDDKKQPAADKPTNDSPSTAKKDTPYTAATPANNDPKRPPTINIIDTVSIKRIVICYKDSASTTERIGLKLGEIYGAKLGKILKDNKLTVTGAPMAWYKTEKAPFFFEAGMPVDKKPAKLPAGAFIKETEAGGALMLAHFYGPYEMGGMAYEAIREKMKAAKATSTGAPYEIYIGDPMVEKDPYKVLTDIVFPVKLPAEQKQQP